MQNFNARNKHYKGGPKLDLGRSWALFGEGFGTVWASLWLFWGLLGRILGVLNQAFFKHGPKIGSRMPSGWILGGFSMVLGKFWEGFGADFRDFWNSFG